MESTRPLEVVGAAAKCHLALTLTMPKHYCWFRLVQKSELY
jgi:hypothetical protein